jgi:rhodanese-related sulfurtransferase
MVAERRELLLVDIRPLSERRSEIGFIPASIAVPLDELAELADLDAEIVLYCMSGRRSASAREALAARWSRPPLHLHGGLLAWEAAGLPVCRAPAEGITCPADVLSFRRLLIACFVAINAEVALDHARTQIDPYAMLQACFSHAGVSWDEPTIDGLYRVLDWAGVTSFRSGCDLRLIATNLSEMYATLDALARANRV